MFQDYAGTRDKNVILDDNEHNSVTSTKNVCNTQKYLDGALRFDAS